MKNILLLTGLLILALTLSACGAIPGLASGSGATGTSGNSLRTNRTAPLSSEAKLALGTIKLEGTDQAVDPGMAAKLIPLWQLMAQLKSSNSSAPQEVAAVQDQIRATMNPAQLSTIDGMKLTQGDIFTSLQAQANASGGATDSSGQGTTRGFTGGNGAGGPVVFGGGPPGGFPGGGFGGGGFGGARTGGTASNGTTTGSSSLTAAQATQARQNALSSLVITQLVRLLETKVGS